MFLIQDGNESPIRRKKPLLVVLALAVLIAVPIFWLIGQMHAADKALDVFGEKLIAKDYDGAYSAASKDFQSSTSRQQFVEQQTALCAKFGTLKAVKREGSKTALDLNGTSTTIDATLVFEKAECQFWFKLKKVSGSWRVYGYRGGAIVRQNSLRQQSETGGAT